eukprot:6118711-Alexandrium_andersonii.AAC.1
MTSYSFALYTEAHAITLAKCWVANTQCIWDVAARSGVARDRFAQTDVEGFSEPADVLAG